MIKAIIFDFQGTLFNSPSQLNPGAKELMEFAKSSGIKMAGITSGSYADAILAHLGLNDFLDVIKTVSMSKSPDDFEDVLEQLGVKAEETVAIGDQVSQEVRCINLLGGTSILVHGGREPSASVNVHEHPDHSVKGLQEAMEVIQQLLKEEE